MELQCKVEVGAAARAKVFAFWTDGAKRGLWEDDLERLAIDGEIKAGASGVMKLRDKPEMRFTIICQVPYDSIPIRSWSLFRVEGIIRTMIESHRQEELKS